MQTMNVSVVDTINLIITVSKKCLYIALANGKGTST